MKEIGKIVYIDGFGTFIGSDHDRIYIKTKGSDHKTYMHLFDLDAVVVNNSCSFSSQAIVLLIRNDVEVLFSEWNGSYCGRVEGLKSKNLFARKAQVLLSNQPEQILKISKEIVLAKISAMHEVCNYKDILIIQDKIKNTTNYESLLGIEGASSKIYFKVVREKFKEVGMDFSSRKFRPAPDPSNSLLSLGYNLLFAEVSLLARAFGLDPAFGFLHRDYYGRDSLVCDLMEPFRSRIADNYVFYAIHKIGILPRDFKIEVGECQFYNMEKRREFYKVFRKEFYSDNHRLEIMNFIRLIYDLVIENASGKSVLMTKREPA
jgi:CRISP-associated protein Cas1